MPEEVEVETQDLQETLDELHEERLERDREKKESAWTKYIALSTAFLAVFAAIGALQSGGLVNEAMISQIRASDTWNEYQADKQKAELFTIQADALLDRGIVPTAKPENTAKESAKAEAEKTEGEVKTKKDDTPAWKLSPPPVRLREYMSAAEKEFAKTASLREEAQKLEEESREMIERHHHFAWSVALIQVAIALSAIAALTRMRIVWAGSLLIGLIGIILFVMGLMPGR